MKDYNIILCGVGGQGTILASKIIAQTAVRLGVNCRVGETHGMSQRGGSVVSHVRIGDNVLGAITPENQGQMMLAFEPVESLRYMNFLEPNGWVVLNTHPIVPTSVNAGLAKYPAMKTIDAELRKATNRIKAIPASEIANSIGSIITLNMVILGAASCVPGYPFSADETKKSIQELVKPAYLELNIKAFESGVTAFNQ
ncbi:indolepyruvate ferredoxin oxidoreductase subunit beta [bacterium]|nr:indolepyruvate ferredoxin oxidoreductase subunit beta [bacterium]